MNPSVPAALLALRPILTKLDRHNAGASTEKNVEESRTALANRVASAVKLLESKPPRVLDALARMDEGMELCRHLASTDRASKALWEEWHRVLRSTERTLRVNHGL